MNYSKAELEALLLDLESELTERKESASDRSKIRRTICAFANDLSNHGKPGILFIGAKDDGSCAHLTITDEIITTIAQMRSNGDILPQPSLSVEKITLRGGDMLVVQVYPSDAPPVRCKGRIWIRAGSTVREATPEEERRLSERRRSRDLPFDHRPAGDATLNDLQINFFKETYLPSAVEADVLEQNQRSLEQQLRLLRFLAANDKPTYGAVLVFGKDPLSFVPGAYLQFVRFHGSAVDDPVKDQKQISGPLCEMISKLDDLLNINISTASNPAAGPIEARTPDYPVVALRQLARNALMHRAYEQANAPARIYWFDDQVEISNPGGLYGHVTCENLGRGATAYRNPLLAEAMRVLGYVQNFGAGIPMAEAALSKNGNPPIEFRIEPTFFFATIRNRS